jgi:hypothetical protein
MIVTVLLLEIGMSICWRENGARYWPKCGRGHNHPKDGLGGHPKPTIEGHFQNLDRRESWPGSTVLRRGGDKIVVKRNHNGHYVFFSVRDDRDPGTIIDFVQRRQHGNLGAVRQMLRPWIDRPAAALPWLAKLEPTGPDRMRVEREYQRMRDAPRHPYLEYDRCLPAALLRAPRFAGRVRIDRRGNAVFPHFDGAGLCG